MEWWLVGIGAMVVIAILNTDRQAEKLRRSVARVDSKVNLILEQMNIAFEESAELSDRVKELARDPTRKIEAIKAHREETGTGLAEAKEAVEAFIDSLRR